MSTAPVFFRQHTDLAEARGGSRIRLAGPEGRHAALVRRLKPGERVDLCNGEGLVAECVVAVAHKESLDLDVVSVASEPPATPRIIVVQALPKGDRGETAVETMTEIGVDVIVPWAASRSITQWKGERGEKALGKWRATAREAAKQSRRSWWPVVEPLATTAEVVKLLGAAATSQALVLHEEAETALAGIDVRSEGDVVLVIGPEGSITPQETAAFEAVGASSYRMGPTVLRTSTAGTAAATVVLAKSGRWG
jgi:16S rRNA (uracil1498-N3)-methyltransferase